VFHLWQALSVFRRAGIEIVKAFAGDRTSFFLAQSGEVYSCGYNGGGALGRVAASGSETSVNLGLIPGLPSDIVDIAASLNTTFLTSTGEVWNCGANIHYSLGRNIGGGSETFVNLARLDAVPPVAKIAAGFDTSHFLTVDGEIWSAGNNTFGGRGPVSGSWGFMNATFPADVIRIAPGDYHTVFLLSDGTAYSVGRNHVGQLGRTGGDTPVLAQVQSLPGDVIYADCGYGQSMFLTASGEVCNCGRNMYGELGRVTASGSGSYVNMGTVGAPLPEDVPVTMVIAGNQTTLFLMSDGAVYGCGVNIEGTCGRVAPTGGVSEPNLGPADDPLDSGIVSVSCYGFNALAMTSDGKFLSWGRNESGGLGRAVLSGGADSTNIGEIDFSILNDTGA
jgi:alpha-tubulin suppressor-like RCC1 family protein